MTNTYLIKFLSCSSNLITIHVITADNNSKPISFKEPERRAFHVTIKRGKCCLDISCVLFWKLPSLKRIFLSCSSNLITIHVIIADNNSKPISFKEPERRAFHVTIKRGKCCLDISCVLSWKLPSLREYRSKTQTNFLSYPHQPTTTLVASSSSQAPTTVCQASITTDPTTGSE